mmetsp:Transcript_41311/g.127643  ORF Transcript_41311/g.127643 Transcript_41311/m.127643 type:complete len:200 (-) Transcript_41311:21-620(-)
MLRSPTARASARCRASALADSVGGVRSAGSDPLNGPIADPMWSPSRDADSSDVREDATMSDTVSGDVAAGIICAPPKVVFVGHAANDVARDTIPEVAAPAGDGSGAPYNRDHRRVGATLICGNAPSETYVIGAGSSAGGGCCCCCGASWTPEYSAGGVRGASATGCWTLGSGCGDDDAQPIPCGCIIGWAKDSSGGFFQ